MTLLDGRKLSQKILDELREEIKGIAKPLRLAIVMVGKDPTALSFIKQKEKSCNDVEIGFKFYKYPEDITTAQLRKNVNTICKLKKNTGVIIQLPLPPHINKQYMLNTVPPEKDVDALSEKSLGRFYTGRLPILPPTIAGIMSLLREYKIEVKGKNTVIVGAGTLVGKPMATHLIHQGATVTVLNEHTSDISRHTKNAEILISGVGKPGLITGDMVSEGVVVVDAGLSMEGPPAEKSAGEARPTKLGGKIRGDVDFDSVSKKASYITPVPGGVGPMTVAMLLVNVVTLAEKDKN